jgi:hypothetical protein
VAVAIRQQVDPSYLLQPGQWRPQGWTVIRSQVLRQVQLGATGQPVVPVGVDAFEWTDFQGFGISRSDDGIARLNQAIAQRGGTLYAYTLFRRDIVNFLGIHFWSYRLLLLHNPGPLILVEWAVFILAAAFAAVIFIQYMTIGKSPALQDLAQAWSGVLNSAGQAVGTAGAGIAQPFIVVTIAAGVLAIAFASAQKSAGVHARTPTTHVSGKVKGKHGELGVGSG